MLNDLAGSVRGERRWIDSASDIARQEEIPYDQALTVKTIPELLSSNAERYEHLDALVYLHSTAESDVLRVTHRKLFDRVVRAGTLFRQCGIRREDAVAVIAPHMASTHVAMWGAQVAGRAFPINYLLAPDHIAHLLRLASVKVVVMLGPSPELSIYAGLLEAIGRAECVERVFEIDPDERNPGPASFQARVAVTVPQSGLATEAGAHSIASLYHTGGTTGLPKLLVHTHENEVHVSWFAAQYYRFGRGDRMLNGFPLFHVAGAFVYGLAALKAGGSLFIPTLNGMRNKQFINAVWEYATRYEITHFGCVPTVLSALLNTSEQPAGSTVRLALTGGSPLPADLASRFEDRFGVPVRNIFGMTECVGVVSIEPAGGPRVPGSVGLPLPYTRVVSLPLEDANPTAITHINEHNEAGQLAIHGPHVSPGYVNSSLNRATFTEDGWLLSGDIGYVDGQSRVFLTGRAKDLIIRGAHNIDPRSIEEVVQRHQDVLACAAVGQPDAYAGEVPVVFVVLRDGVSLSESMLLDSIKPQIPEPPAVPKRIIVLDAMPLTAVGKIYKPALRTHAAKAKIEELLEADFADGICVVNCTESGGRLKASIKLAANADLSRTPAMKLKLAELPIDIEWSE